MKRVLFFILILALALIIYPSARVASRVLDRATVANNIPVTAPGTFEGCGGPVLKSINPAWEQTIVEKTNEIRMQNGLPPLKRIETLDEASRYHVADMSNNDYFDHNTFNRVNGQLKEVCDPWNRIEHYYTNWQALAENIAAGQTSPDMAMSGWMHSPEHRHNILSDSYSEIGVGFYKGTGEYVYYWGQDFGRRDGVFPLVIDGEKAQTKSATVPVYIYGTFTKMRIVDNNGKWSEWMPFKNNFQWTLTDTPGTHTLTAELAGIDGNVTSQDSIDLVR